MLSAHQIVIKHPMQSTHAIPLEQALLHLRMIFVIPLHLIVLDPAYRVCSGTAGPKVTWQTAGWSTSGGGSLEGLPLQSCRPWLARDAWGSTTLE